MTATNEQPIRGRALAIKRKIWTLTTHLPDLGIRLHLTKIKRALEVLSNSCCAIYSHIIWMDRGCDKKNDTPPPPKTNSKSPWKIVIGRRSPFLLKCLLFGGRLCELLRAYHFCSYFLQFERPLLNLHFPVVLLQLISRICPGSQADH